MVGFEPGAWQAALMALDEQLTGADPDDSDENPVELLKEGVYSDPSTDDAEDSL